MKNLCSIKYIDERKTGYVSTANSGERIMDQKEKGIKIINIQCMAGNLCRRHGTVGHAT